jgi:hypothetical protein
MLYGTKCWAVKNQHRNKISVAEMRMLCWMCDKTRHDRVAPIVEKIGENRLRWFGHV